MSMVFDFIQTACVLIVLSYLLSRANFFSQVQGGARLSLPKTLLTVCVFVFIALYGVLVRPHLMSDLHVDTRIAGIALAGLLFGYLPSLLVLIPTAVVTALMQEPTLAADLVAMMLAVFLSGYCHKRFPDFDAFLSGIVVGLLEVCHMLLIVMLMHPMTAAKEVVYAISFPMIIVNGCAVTIFVLIITDINEWRRLWDKESLSRSEFAVAARIQRSLLNTDFSLDPRLDLSAYLEPASDVGGDLYSYYLDKHRYFKFMIGDVSGKGVAASLTMGRCATLFDEYVQHSSQPDEILTALNRRLCQRNLAQMFVTAMVGCLDLQTGRLVYANAGHTTSYRVEARRPAEKMAMPKGKPLGILPNASYANEEIFLRPGQRIFTYTDGVTEAENPEHLLFGGESLENALSDLPYADAVSVQEAILNAVRRHGAGTRQSDDITILSFGLNALPLSYELPNRIEDFLNVAARADADLRAASVPEKQIQDVELVLEELVGNIIRYGYPDGRSGSIRFYLWTGETPMICIEDDSDPFDPFAAGTPVADLPPEQRPVGGLGIYLTAKRVTLHEYRSSARVNTLFLQLRSR